MQFCVCFTRRRDFKDKVYDQYYKSIQMLAIKRCASLPDITKNNANLELDIPEQPHSEKQHRLITTISKPHSDDPIQTKNALAKSTSPKEHPNFDNSYYPHKAMPIRKYSLYFKSDDSEDEQQVQQNQKPQWKQQRNEQNNQFFQKRQRVMSYTMKPISQKMPKSQEQDIKFSEKNNGDSAQHFQELPHRGESSLPFECEICYQRYQQIDTDKAFHCEHIFCSLCLEAYFQEHLKIHKTFVCPNCSAKINQVSKSFKQMKTQQYKKYRRIQFEDRILQETSYKLCPNTQCEGKGYLEQEQKSKTGKCVSCKKKYCVKCMLEEHWGSCNKNHVEYLNDNYKYQKCKKCNCVIQRNEGCPHMTCKCGHQFCYGCGTKWSSGHSCWKNRIGSKKTIFKKVDETLTCLKKQQEQNQILSVLKTICYYFTYGLILLLWFLWCFIFGVILYTIVLSLCLAFGYFIGICFLCSEMRYKCWPKVVFILGLIFAPLAYIIAAIGCFIAFVGTKSYSFFIDPCMTGELFPILKLQFP